MRSNGRPIRLKTYEGGTAAAQSPLTELERAVGSCLLFEIPTMRVATVSLNASQRCVTKWIWKISAPWRSGRATS